MDTANIKWSDLLSEAVNKEGTIGPAYKQFYEYSFGNLLLAWMISAGLGIPPGPIATEKRWNQLGRRVLKDAFALPMLVPMWVKDRCPLGIAADQGPSEYKFIYQWRRKWYFLAQTEGKDIEIEVKTQNWSRDLALQKLGIQCEAFTSWDGNDQGYARPNDKVIAINPCAQHHERVFFHEVAHVLLHKRAALRTFGHSAVLPIGAICEVEAECVAYLLLSHFDLEGKSESRGYIQHWLSGNPVTEMQARRIFGAVDKILKAGKPAKPVKPAKPKGHHDQRLHQHRYSQRDAPAAQGSRSVVAHQHGRVDPPNA